MMFSPCIVVRDDFWQKCVAKTLIQKINSVTTFLFTRIQAFYATSIKRYNKSPPSQGVATQFCVHDKHYITIHTQEVTTMSALGIILTNFNWDNIFCSIFYFDQLTCLFKIKMKLIFTIPLYMNPLVFVKCFQSQQNIYTG